MTAQRSSSISTGTCAQKAVTQHARSLGEATSRIPTLPGVLSDDMARGQGSRTASPSAGCQTCWTWRCPCGQSSRRQTARCWSSDSKLSRCQPERPLCFHWKKGWMMVCSASTAVRLQAAPPRARQQVEAGLGVVGLAELAELVGACVVEGVDPEAVAKVGHLRDDGLLVEREVAEPVQTRLEKIKATDKILPVIPSAIPASERTMTQWHMPHATCPVKRHSRGPCKPRHHRRWLPCSRVDPDRSCATREYSMWHGNKTSFIRAGAECCMPNYVLVWSIVEA